MAENIVCNAVAVSPAPTAPDFSWATGWSVGCVNVTPAGQVAGCWIHLRADGTATIGWYGEQKSGTWLPAGRSASEYEVEVDKGGSTRCPSGAMVPALPGSDAFLTPLSLATNRSFDIGVSVGSTDTLILSMIASVKHVATGTETLTGVYGTCAGSSLVECQLC